MYVVLYSFPSLFFSPLLFSHLLLKLKITKMDSVVVWLQLLQTVFFSSFPLGITNSLINLSINTNTFKFLDKSNAKGIASSSFIFVQTRWFQFTGDLAGFQCRVSILPFSTWPSLNLYYVMYYPFISWWFFSSLFWPLIPVTIFYSIYWIRDTPTASRDFATTLLCMSNIPDPCSRESDSWTY